MNQKTRTFYVDAALSKSDQENKRYWRCSVVENNQNVVNFTDLIDECGMGGKASEAEAYTIFKLIKWLKEQNWQGQARVFSDVVNNNHNNIKKAQELAIQNNIDLEIEWVKGSQNLADYFSRQNITIDRKGDPRRGKVIALLSEPNWFNITLNIPLGKVISSRVINRIEKHLYFIKHSQNNEDIDVIWNAWELYWALKCLIEETSYIQQEEEKEKMRQFIKNLETILREKAD